MYIKNQMKEASHIQNLKIKSILTYWRQQLKPQFFFSLKKMKKKENMNNCEPDVIIQKYALWKPHCIHVCGQIVWRPNTIRCSSHVTYRCIRRIVNGRRTIHGKTNTNADGKCLLMNHSQPITIGIVENIHVYAELRYTHWIRRMCIVHNYNVC